MLVTERIEATDARYDLAKRELILPRVELANDKLVADQLADGTLNWRGAFRERPGTVSSRRGGGPSSVFHTRVEAVSLDNVEVHFTDHTRASPLELTAGAKHADFKLELASDEKLTNVIIDDIRLALTNASVRALGSNKRWSTSVISLDGGHLDTASRTAVTIGWRAKAVARCWRRDGASRCLRHLRRHTRRRSVQRCPPSPPGSAGSTRCTPPMYRT
jgi:hypothetical protein